MLRRILRWHMARKQGKTFLCELRVAGERIRKSFASLEAAKEYEAFIHTGGKHSAEALALHRGDQPVRPSIRDERDSTSFSDVAWTAYELRWRRKRASESAYIIVRELIQHFGAQTAVHKITAATVQDWRLSLFTKGLSGGTINRKITHLRQALIHAKVRGLIAEVPELGKPEEENGSRERFLSPEEARSLIGSFDRDDFRLFSQFLLNTGARFGEAQAIRWSDVCMDSDKPSVTFRWSTTKTKKTRRVPLTQQALQALSGALKLAPTPPLGGPWSGIAYNTYQRAFRKAVDEAGLTVESGEPIVAHTLRHTCASWLSQL